MLLGVGLLQDPRAVRVLNVEEPLYTLNSEPYKQGLLEIEDTHRPRVLQ